MIRKIIRIDEKKCDGCGLCLSACHEGAIGLADGKAKLLRDDYCDGLGNCLPVCPRDAISFEEREAAAFDEVAVKVNSQSGKQAAGPERNGPDSAGPNGAEPKTDAQHERQASELRQWPVQIKLVPPKAPFFDHANLLIAADCSAYAYGDFHHSFMKNRITLIGCPKLDEGDYTEKLTAILRANEIESVTVTRMEVPCCGGIEQAVRTALKDSGKRIPWQVVIISTEGGIRES